jgi:hypothetical protein
MRLSIRDYPFTKEAQVAAVKRTAQSLFKIIQFLFYRVPEKERSRFFSRVKGKVMRIAPNEMSIKKMPPSSVIGQSIAITKNLLSGLSPVFVGEVLRELVRLLATSSQYTQ